MEEKKELLQSFVDDVFHIMGDSVKKIILYGSYARGDFRPDSDMDIMILTSLDEDEIRKLENQLYDRAFEYELSDGVNI
ncbi:MAG: nucleotidyltransferase domain-containing protein, partial [Clostridiales bacterium]|nr:nucleotidyltransferase domain-containing protein [Clostridiales bacterium]